MVSNCGIRSIAAVLLLRSHLLLELDDFVGQRRTAIFPSAACVSCFASTSGTNINTVRIKTIYLGDVHKIFTSYLTWELHAMPCINRT